MKEVDSKYDHKSCDNFISDSFWCLWYFRRQSVDNWKGQMHQMDRKCCFATGLSINNVKVLERGVRIIWRQHINLSHKNRDQKLSKIWDVIYEQIYF